MISAHLNSVNHFFPICVIYLRTLYSICSCYIIHGGVYFHSVFSCTLHRLVCCTRIFPPSPSEFHIITSRLRCVCCALRVHSYIRAFSSITTQRQTESRGRGGMGRGLNARALAPSIPGIAMVIGWGCVMRDLPVPRTFTWRNLIQACCRPSIIKRICSSNY